MTEVQNIEKVFSSFSDLKIGIVGDLMVDSYVWGNVDRISPEAPVPVVSVRKKEYRLGGAGNVAMNLQALGVNVQIVSVIGDDSMAGILQKLFHEKGIKSDYLLNSSSRITTCKTRVISHNQQMIRLDEEDTHDLLPSEEEKLLENLFLYIKNENPGLIIFQDYNKGVLTQKVISKAIDICREKNVLTAVDPKKSNFFLYKHVTIFKPNFKEVKMALGITTENADFESLKKMHHQLKERLDHQVSLITLSEKGIFYQSGEDGNIIASHLRKIADVSGAGDTVVAVGSAVYAQTKNILLMAEIANIAGGLVCEEIGTAIIKKESLLSEVKRLLKLKY
ncbi:MAG: PfkB family carbohydrate kinase [Bacteroidota bacterium]